MRIVFRLVLASLLTLYRKVPDLVFLSLRLVLGVATPSERSRLREVALRVVPGIAILLLFLGQRAGPASRRTRGRTVSRSCATHSSVSSARVWPSSRSSSVA